MLNTDEIKRIEKKLSGCVNLENDPRSKRYFQNSCMINKTLKFKHFNFNL